jgi:hypothetical protein
MGYNIQFDDNHRRNQIIACNDILRMIAAGRTTGMTEMQVVTMKIALENHKKYLEGLVPFCILPNMPGNGPEPQ